MRLAAALILVSAAALSADAGDPPGTVMLDLEPGASAPLDAPEGANVLCDDASVVTADFEADGGTGFVLRALKAGSTLCGLWLPGQKPGGLYRVYVSSGARDGGAG